MTNDDTLLLKDPQFLMVLLATIVKKYQGAITVSESDMASITTDDAIGLFKHAEDDSAFILKIAIIKPTKLKATVITKRG